jgi:hypothetical protein
MKKILKTFFVTLVLLLGLNVYASNASDAKHFFNKYVSDANSYSPAIIGYYSPNAKIIRQVIKPNGQLVDVPFTMSQYQTQLKISSATAKIRNYKNHYSNIKVIELDKNTYRIDAYRQPSTGGAKLKTETTVQKQSNGKWLITRELMQTREQIFLKYAK